MTFLCLCLFRRRGSSHFGTRRAVRRGRHSGAARQYGILVRFRYSSVKGPCYSSTLVSSRGPWPPENHANIARCPATPMGWPAPCKKNQRQKNKESPSTCCHRFRLHMDELQGTTGVPEGVATTHFVGTNATTQIPNQGGGVTNAVGLGAQMQGTCF